MDNSKLIIIGASGHGKVIADIAVLCGYKEIEFLDDDESLVSCMGYRVLGKVRTADQYPDADFFVAIGNPWIREKVQNMLGTYGLNTATLVHPKAVIADHVLIGIGTVVMAGVIINSDSKIGNGCIINTGSSVDHDNVIDDFVHVSVGSHLAGAIHVGRYTWIGAGAVVSNHIDICGECMIGAGAVVVKDISRPGTYIGVPANRLEKSTKKELVETNGGGGI